MNFERIAQKLRRDGPVLLAGRVYDRLRRRWLTRRRRARWQTDGAGIGTEEAADAFSAQAAMRLWPGAADRSWGTTAAGRWPELHAEAARRAAAAAEGRFDLLGSGEMSVLDARGRIRWHDDFKSNTPFPADVLYLDVPIRLPKDGSDIKVPWELSRFQHVFAFLWTDPQRYRDVFLRQWADWLRANPTARGVNWACTMDVALRAISWTAALAAWGDTFDDATRRRMAVALAEHGHFIRGNLEWISVGRTNHYFTDIVALAVLGAVLAPYEPAVRWSAFAARELRREIRLQFAPDGFNRECSTTYHRLMVELATVGVLACRVAGRDLGEAAHARLAAAFRAVAALCDSTGRVPLMGDNDSSRVFPLAQRDDDDLRHLLPLGAAVLGGGESAAGDMPPEVALLCGPAALDLTTRGPSASRAPAGAALADSGLFVLGHGADQMVVRCGPLTYAATGSHKHLDQLSLTATVGGRQFIVDPGQYCYTPWPELRNSFVVSESHNAVIVDGEPQCRMFILGPITYSIIDEAEPAGLAWEVGADRVCLVVRHRGYRRLPGGADHERAVVYDAPRRCWTVTDRLPLAGTHRLEWRLHLHPDVAAEPAEGGWRLRHGDVTLLLHWTSAEPPVGSVERGWYAPAYGRRRGTNVLVFRLESHGPVEQTLVMRTEERA